MGGLAGTGRKYIPGREHRLDRMASTGLFDDVVNVRRPGTPALRLQDQDRDGLQAEVLYGILGVGAKVKDPAVAAEVFRIYNDWLADFCAHDRRRFVGLAAIPCHDAQLAAAEARRAAKLGLGGLDFAFNWDMVPLWHRYWEPFWAAAAETGLPVHFHTIGVRKDPPPAGLEMDDHDRLLENATRISAFQLAMGSILSAVIHCGALERHPSLRIVLGESGIGWIPYVLERMDEEWEGRYRERLGMKMKPSEYWRRQCRATFQNDRIGAKLLDDLGVECVMWGSDYPHADGVFPDSQEYIRRQFGHLPEATRRQITCENAGRFYGLIR